jgi:D-lactate dehydrogenase
VKSSDLISIHVPYIKGENDNFVNEEMIKQMKDNAVIVNVARKNLVDLDAVIKNLKNDKLFGFAADVFYGEEKIVNKELTSAQVQAINPQIDELIKLYPRVLLSPHIAYFTDEAVKNMAEITFMNLKQLMETNTCDNAIQVLA